MLERFEQPSAKVNKLNNKTGQGMGVRDVVIVFLIGVLLGVVFVKSEVACWDRIHKMFLFEEAHMYLIISVAIGVAMCSMAVIRRLGIKTIDGTPIQYSPKRYHLGVIFGGCLFGAGWAITGACPGPIYAQIGGGEWMAIFTFLGAMLGVYSYAALQPHLPH